MARQREQARAAGKFRMAAALDYDGPATAFHGYAMLETKGNVLALYKDGAPVNELAEGELGVIGFVSRGSDGEWSFQSIRPMEERDNVYRDADRACMMQEGPKHALGTHFLRGICLGSAKSRKECLLWCGYELEVVAA